MSFNLTNFIVFKFFGNNWQKSLIGILVIIIVLYYIISKSYVTIEHLGPRDFIREPTLLDGDKFMLKTRNGKYITACSDCKSEANIYSRCKYSLCQRDVPYNSSIFTLHQHRDGRVSIETASFHFWKNCKKCIPDCDGAICADGINKNNRTNKFILIKNLNGTISLKADNGRLIQPCPCNQTCGNIYCSMGLGGDVEMIVEKVEVMPPPPRVLQFKPKRGRSSVFDGVSLSMLM